MDDRIVPRIDGEHRIEAARSGRSSCKTCGQAIANSELRVAEQVDDLANDYTTFHFHHLECAIAARPGVVVRALGRVSAGLDLDIAGLTKRLAAAMPRPEERQVRVAKLGASVQSLQPHVQPDTKTNELLDALEGNPDDRATLAVLADHLQSRGDLRGELIALQLEGRPESRDRIDELIRVVAAPMARGEWGIGYLRAIEVSPRTNSAFLTKLGLWRHASLRLLSELTLQLDDFTIASRIAERLPRSLRRFALTAPADPALAPLFALPHLVDITVPAEVFGIANEQLAHHELIVDGAVARSAAARARVAAEAPPPALEGWVEHTAKPEWGRGRLVERRDGRVTIEFCVGRKTFKADAAFLKFG